MSNKEENEQPMENWKQFQGTELGALMSQLYGNNKPKVSYPKPKTSNKFNPNQPFQPFGSKIETKSETKRNVKIAVPQPLKNKNSNDIIHPIDMIARRKTEGVISREIDEIRMKQSHYRPAHIKPISSDLEKEKLSQIFEYKGGKILPNELTNPITLTPFEITEKNNEKKRIQEIRERRGVGTKKLETRSQLSPNELIAEQINTEINERYNYIKEMKELKSLNKNDENKILYEISKRVNELNKLQI